MSLSVNNVHSIEDNEHNAKQKIDVLTLVYMVLVQSVASHQETITAEAAHLEGNANVQKALGAQLEKMNIDALAMKKMGERVQKGSGFCGFWERFGTGVAGIFGHADPKYNNYDIKQVDNKADMDIQMMRNAVAEKNRGNVEGSLSVVQQTANIDSTGIDMQAKAVSQMMQESMDNCVTQKDLTTKASLTKN